MDKFYIAVEHVAHMDLASGEVEIIPVDVLDQEGKGWEEDAIWVGWEVTLRNLNENLEDEDHLGSFDTMKHAIEFIARLRSAAHAPYRRVRRTLDQ